MTVFSCGPAQRICVNTLLPQLRDVVVVVHRADHRTAEGFGVIPLFFIPLSSKRGISKANQRPGERMSFVQILNAKFKM